MAWTTPRTWVTSEIVTATIMNTHVRDNLNALRDLTPGAFMGSGSESVNIPHAGGGTIIPLDNSGTLWFTAPSSLDDTNDRINVGIAGKFLCVGAIAWPAGNAGLIRSTIIIKNGTNTERADGVGIASNSWIQRCMALIICANTTDYIQLMGYHESGGSTLNGITGSLAVMRVSG